MYSQMKGIKETYSAFNKKKKTFEAYLASICNEFQNRIIFEDARAKEVFSEFRGKSARKEFF